MSTAQELKTDSLANDSILHGLNSAIDNIDDIGETFEQQHELIKNLKFLQREDSLQLVKLRALNKGIQENLESSQEKLVLAQKNYKKAIKELNRFRPSWLKLVAPIAGGVLMTQLGENTSEKVAFGTGTFSILFTLEYFGYGITSLVSLF